MPTLPNVLHMQCPKCKVAASCPRRGSSPLAGGRGRTLVCRIIGGYGREPVDAGALSEETRARMEKDGPCLTLAEVPTLDESSGHTYYEVVKVFHRPVLHPREKVDARMDMMFPKSYKEK